MRSAKPVFFFLSAGWGPVIRTLPIAKRLADEEIASAFAIGGAIGAHIRAAGFDLIDFAIPAFPAPADQAQAWWSPYHFLAFCNRDPDLLLAYVEAYRQAILDGQPSVIVTDINPVAALAAKSLGLPHVTISQSIFLPFRKSSEQRWRLPDALPAINAVLRHYRAEPVESAEDLEVGEVSLLPSIPEFDPLHEPPSSVRFVGPMLGNDLIPLRSADGQSSADALLEIFLYPGRPRDMAGPSGQTLVNGVLRALNGMNVRVTVATAGHDFDIPQNALPHLNIVPWRVISSLYRPDLIIHHGGHGACLTAISAGIASVIVPTHAEREYNAANVAALGCGDFIAAERADAHTIRQAIEAVMEDAACARTCARWSQTILERQYGGADLAARIIMGLM
jgi:UDP:flavonoid glycosyltransferase YjiC (YdhE family)